MKIRKSKTVEKRSPNGRQLGAGEALVVRPGNVTSLLIIRFGECFYRDSGGTNSRPTDQINRLPDRTKNLLWGASERLQSTPRYVLRTKTDILGDDYRCTPGEVLGTFSDSFRLKSFSILVEDLVNPKLFRKDPQTGVNRVPGKRSLCDQAM